MFGNLGARLLCAKDLHINNIRREAGTFSKTGDSEDLAIFDEKILFSFDLWRFSDIYE